MPVGIDDLDVVTFLILAGETITDIPMAAGGFSFTGGEPFIQQDSTPAWRVRVTRPPALTVMLDFTGNADPEVARPFEEIHEEHANELGLFSFSSWLVDNYGVDVGDLVEFYDRGFCIGGGVIRVERTEKLSVALQGKPRVTWTGVRPIGVLEEGTVRAPRPGIAGVRAARGLGSLTRDRTWGWFGVDYDDSSWVPATQIVRLDATSAYWTGLLPDFEDTTAYWVWASRRPTNPALDEWSPEGECLFRQTFTVPANVEEVEVEVAGDAQVTLWYEGEEGMATQYSVADPDEVRRRRFLVVPGPNLIAVAGVNDPDPEGDQVQNPGGVIWSVWSVDPATGDRLAVLAHSDSTAVMLEYPASRPGVTPAEALLDVFEELQDLGYFTWVTPTFTRDLDSAGRPWAEVGEIGTKVGFTLWKFVQQMIAVYIDTDLSPATNEWHAWSKDTRGRASGVILEAAPVGGDPELGNLDRHIITRTLKRANVVMSISRFGWHEHSFVSPGVRRIDGTLDLGAVPSEEGVDRYARAELAASDQDRVQHDAGIRPRSDADKPLWSYRVGDTVTIDGEEWTVASIKWRRDRHAQIHWDEAPEDS